MYALNGYLSTSVPKTVPCDVTDHRSTSASRHTKKGKYMINLSYRFIKFGPPYCFPKAHFVLFLSTAHRFLVSYSDTKESSNAEDIEKYKFSHKKDNQKVFENSTADFG